MQSESKIYLTGATSHLGSEILSQLLEVADCQVVCPLAEVRENPALVELKNALGDGAARVKFIKMDSLDADQVIGSLEGCTYLIHTESGVETAGLSDEELETLNEEEVENLLDGCLVHGVKRCIYTSSLLTCISFDHPEMRPYSCTDWVEYDKNQSAYAKSILITEKKIWNYMEEHSNQSSFDCIALLPGLVLGKCLISQSDPSFQIITDLINHKYKKVPKLFYGFIDVQDLAAAHISALSSLVPGNQRFILAREVTTLKKISDLLQLILSSHGFTFP